ncbi:MAG: hypothetical protein AABW88_02930 [Nanoarchaeota archaeon]
MKSTIKSINRTEKRLYVIFKLDNNLLRDIENSFKKLKPRFRLSNFKKYNGQKWLTDLYESNNKSMTFTIVVKDNELRLKIEASSIFINRFLNYIMKNSEFAKYTKLRYKL